MIFLYFIFFILGVWFFGLRDSIMFLIGCGRGALAGPGEGWRISWHDDWIGLPLPLREPFRQSRDGSRSPVHTHTHIIHTHTHTHICYLTHGIYSTNTTLSHILNHISKPPQANYNKATQAELAKNYDAAFRLYIRSAEAYLHLGRAAPAGTGEALKNKWKSAANRALERAEKIKAVTDRQKLSSSSTAGEGLGFSVDPDDPGAGGAGAAAGPSVSGGLMRLTPVATNLFSLREFFFFPLPPFPPCS